MALHLNPLSPSTPSNSLTVPPQMRLLWRWQLWSSHWQYWPLKWPLQRHCPQRHEPCPLHGWEEVEVVVALGLKHCLSSSIMPSLCSRASLSHSHRWPMCPTSQLSPAKQDIHKSPYRKSIDNILHMGYGSVGSNPTLTSEVMARETLSNCKQLWIKVSA